jgi:predicted nucleotidyltransferase
MTDFEALLRLLVEHDVAFIIVGGAAAIIHGSSRLTQDLDLVYERTPENVARLVGALEGHAPYPRGAPPGLPFRWSESTVRMGLNFTLQTDLGAIDLLGEIPGGGGYDHLHPHTIEVDLFGVRCRSVDLPTLIRVKRAAGRPKDLEAIAELEAMQREQLDPDAID